MASPFAALTSRLGARLTSGLGRLAPGVERLGERVGPAARLARIDLPLMRAWMKNAGAVEAALGRAEAAAYTELVLRCAELDPALARHIAHMLPDHLARVPAAERPRYRSLLKAVLADRPAALGLVTRTLPDLLSRLDDESLSRFLAQALALHHQSARKAESFLRMESGEAQQEASRLQRGLTLAEVRRTLTHYARAHCGEDVQVRPGSAGFTDGRHIYLPERMDRFGDARDFLIYRVLTARNAGYIEFGTLDLELDFTPGDWPERRTGEVEVERLLRGFQNGSIARDLFTLMENTRIEARVRAEYPGVARDMDTLAQAWRPERPDWEGLAPAEQAIEGLARLAIGLSLPEALPPAVEAAIRAGAAGLDRLRDEAATVETTVEALSLTYPWMDALLVRVDEASLRPPRAEGGTSGEGARGPEGRPDPEAEPTPPRPNRDPTEDDPAAYRPMTRDPFGAELRTETMAEEDRSIEDRARDLLSALKQRDSEATLREARDQARREGSSYAEMDAFLERNQAPAGPMRDPTMDHEALQRDPRPQAALAQDPDVQHTGKVVLYPEWDATIEDYKPNWVRLTEYNLQPGGSGFVEAVREEHGALIGQIRRAFEALRPETARRHRGLTDGDEIDIDRAVAERVEKKSGGSPDGRVYMRNHREERDVAVAFLIDMSSSTNEVVNSEAKRIIDVEKQALVLISEAVDAIGDEAAIYGFSGYGRDQVAFYIAKEFTDPWNDSVRERIGRISWKMENRDGAAIRHATKKLLARPARVRLLILLSDGKPLDCGCDHYSDRYAQEDTRVALTEARKRGVHPFCITVDPQGHHYLARMYGEIGYTVIDRIEKLPQRLPQIYRRLTR